jgi:hypothetical protein
MPLSRQPWPGVEPRFKEFTGVDPLGYVVSLNLNRRHLAGAQRAIVAAKIATLKDGQRQVGKSADVATQHQAAAMMNVSERSVRSARQVLDHGSPELITSVEQSKVSVSAAARSLRPSREEITASPDFPAMMAAAPLPKIGDALKTLLKGNRATLVLIST